MGSLLSFRQWLVSWANLQLLFHQFVHCLHDHLEPNVRRWILSGNIRYHRAICSEAYGIVTQLLRSRWLYQYVVPEHLLQDLGFRCFSGSFHVEKPKPAGSGLGQETLLWVTVAVCNPWELLPQWDSKSWFLRTKRIHGAKLQLCRKSFFDVPERNIIWFVLMLISSLF